MEKREWGDWEFRQGGKSTSYQATVPGCIHTDLLANHLIEDPFFGENEKDLQWIGEAEWEYTSHFCPDPQLMEKDHIELVFEGLDTYADVFLNDVRILSADNMFRCWKTNIKEVLKEGENELKIVFYPPGEFNDEKAEDLAYKLPDIRAFTRKSPYHFGWDWGPEFITCGIWKDVYLNAWNNFRIERVHIDHGNIDSNPLPLIISVDIQSDVARAARIQIFDENSGEQIASEKVDLEIGMKRYNIDAEMIDPGLWWPIGLGEQNIYSYRTKITAAGNSDETITQFGIR